MEKIRVIIADDDLSSRTILVHFTKLLPEYEVIGEATTGEELIQLVVKEKPDLALVDISMPDLNGVEASKACKEIHPNLQVIFTTGHDDYAVEAFNLSAVDYIVKPIERTRLFIALEKAKKMIGFQNKAETPAPKNISKLAIRSNNTYLYILINDILFIEKQGRKTIIHTESEQFETSDPLQNLMDRLPENFSKTHRSYLVNLRKVAKIEASGETYLAFFYGTDKNAYISKLKINEVQELLCL
ncbi:response regulator transcription factor [Robertmurraya yapensis]|uniref:Response regulator transcription factor n=1 Tax=Bacillus yapensis TaxID=2492960 RepID=A0A431WKL5_9BACI|nr:LytTR family DNA-binding domain-containing protein [Bacillus yapensis]RTR36158.1 response regulator transcription factor [Bacillus yapensis]TKT05661.1 response regulator [Bacillus yapensis]